MNHLGRYLTRPDARSAGRGAVRPGCEPRGERTRTSSSCTTGSRATTSSRSCTTRCSPTPRASPTSCSRPRPTSRSTDVARSYGSFTRHEMPAVIDRVGESRTNNELVAALAAASRSRRRARSRRDPTLMLVDAFDEIRRRPGRVRTAPPCSSATPHPTAGGPGSPGSTRSTCRATGSSTSTYPLTLITPASPRTINSMFGEFQGARSGGADAPGRRRGAGPGRRRRGPRLQRSGRARDDAERSTTTSCPASWSMPKGLWRRALPGGLTANVFVPDTLVRPRRRRLLQRRARRGRPCLTSRRGRPALAPGDAVRAVVVVTSEHGLRAIGLPEDDLAEARRRHRSRARREGRRASSTIGSPGGTQRLEVPLDLDGSPGSGAPCSRRSCAKSAGARPFPTASSPRWRAGRARRARSAPRWRSNPLPFVIPCHRVVAAGGRIGGYGGGRNAVELKRALLAREGVTFP